MTEADRDAAFAWAARQLSWERRLRELESADVDVTPAVEPTPEPERVGPLTSLGMVPMVPR